MSIRSLVKFAGYSTLAIIGGGTMAAAGIYLYLTPKLPEVLDINDVQMQTPVTIYTSDNKLMGSFGEKKRIPIQAQDIPQNVFNAFLAAEDNRFYSHHGVDPKGLLRAVFQLVTTGAIQGGGSTITMQVARNIYLSLEQTFTRKFSEILLAIKMENQLSKDQIFQLYVNKIFLGKRAYGIQAAAEVYYGKDIRDLDLAQIAMIAGLPKGPSIYNPIVNPDRAIERRDWILGRMRELGYISTEQFRDAIVQPVTASVHEQVLDLHAPYIAEMVRQYMVEHYGQDYDKKGYKVFTTINSTLQETAQQAIVKGIDSYTLRHGYKGAEAKVDDPQSDPNEWISYIKSRPIVAHKTPVIVTKVENTSISVINRDGEIYDIDLTTQFKHLAPYINEDFRGRKPTSGKEVFSVGDIIRVKESNPQQITQLPTAESALVSLRPQDGAVQALVGGYAFTDSKYNRAIQAQRQPGSNIKPLLYTRALEWGMTAATLINDAPVVIKDDGNNNIWRPENSGNFNGPTRFRQALYQSRNMVSIRILQQIGIDNFRQSTQRFGLNPANIPHGYAIALGSYAMTPMQVATAYTVFANGGYRVEPYYIDKIQDAQGRTVYQANPLTVCDLTCGASDSILENSVSLDSLIEESKGRPAPRVVDKQTAYIMNSILRDVIRKGTGRKATVLKRSDIGGKTGTTNGPTDAWFSGFQHTNITSVWFGFDDMEKLGQHEYGGSAALPIWIDYMRVALKGVPIYRSVMPDGMVSVRIDKKTGLRSNQKKGTMMEVFKKENTPKEASTNSESKIESIFQ